MAEKLPILVYHRVHLDDDVTEPNDGGRTDLTLFTQQMKYLKEEGFQISEVLAFPDLNEIIDCNMKTIKI